MSASSLFATLLVVFSLTAGCSDIEPPAADGVSAMLVLSQRSSGYSPKLASWRALVTCWHEGVGGRETVGRTLAPAAEGLADATALRSAESKLGLELPQSYKDFIRAVDEKSLVAFNDSVGMFRPKDIGKVIDLFPELLDVQERFAIEADDESYFVYGVDQDDSTGRTSYLADALAVGRYGSSVYEVIILYPQQRTEDGEFEAAMRYHSGEFRAPSFAELVRQLSHFEVSEADHVPPFSQSSLMQTCAREIELENVWWK